MSRKISYAFEDDGVYALEDGQVIASAPTLEEIHIAGACPNCGNQECPHGPDEDHKEAASNEPDPDQDDRVHFDYDDVDDGQDLASLEEKENDDSKKESATHIITPNGLKGKIMGKTKGLWGDQVTVKFENGHIAHLDVATIKEFINEKTSAVASIEDELREVLAASVDETELGLKIREADLKDITSKIEALARSGKTDEELNELDSLRVQASYELGEVRSAIEYLAAQEPFEPFAPYSYHAVEQESIGGHTSSWLDKVAQDMVDEANATDYDKLLNEGPEVFVASLETAPLADQGTVRTIASEYIRTRTVAARPEVRSKYEELWLDRVEACRKDEYSSRKQKIAKQASVVEASMADIQDEALFS